MADGNAVRLWPVPETMLYMAKEPLHDGHAGYIVFPYAPLSSFPGVGHGPDPEVRVELCAGNDYRVESEGDVSLFWYRKAACRAVTLDGDGYIVHIPHAAKEGGIVYTTTVMTAEEVGALWNGWVRRWNPFVMSRVLG